MAYLRDIYFKKKLQKVLLVLNNNIDIEKYYEQDIYSWPSLQRGRNTHCSRNICWYREDKSFISKIQTWGLCGDQNHEVPYLVRVFNYF